MNIWNSKKLNRKIDSYLNANVAKPNINAIPNVKQAKPKKLTNEYLEILAKKQNVKRKIY